jgi:hypothetical protein
MLRRENITERRLPVSLALIGEGVRPMQRGHDWPVCLALKRML